MAIQKKRLIVTVDADLDDALKLCAQDDERSVSTLISTAMRELLIERGYLQPKKPSQRTVPHSKT